MTYIQYTYVLSICHLQAFVSGLNTTFHHSLDCFLTWCLTVILQSDWLREWAQYTLWFTVQCFSVFVESYCSCSSYKSVSYSISCTNMKRHCLCNIYVIWAYNVPRNIIFPQESNYVFPCRCSVFELWPKITFVNTMCWRKQDLVTINYVAILPYPPRCLNSYR